MNVEQARFNMIEQQIRPWEVSDQRVLKTIGSTPRELFVPENFQYLAFSDIRVDLSHGETMMMPKVEARLLQALNIQPNDRILEIGTGSGYLTALLATLGEHVSSEEIHADLSSRAGDRLEGLDIDNVDLIVTDSLRKRNQFRRFDAIAVTGSLPTLEPNFKHQLEIGGRLFVILGESPAMEAWQITRLSEREWQEESLFETDLKPLNGVTPMEKFTF